VGHPLLTELRQRYKRTWLVALTRRVLEEARNEIAAGGEAPSLESIAASVANRVATEWDFSPRRVINATGTILHTNLGRAPLSKAAQEAMLTVARSYSDLEYHLPSGERGSRQDHVEPLLTLLLGSQAALMVGNNAGAVLLTLAGLAKGREVIVSRGQAVEIGGGFRVPTIMRQSGARLVEVGTTNRTRLDDYANAIGERTAAILHVHPSNFAIVGFTESVPLPDLARLAHSHNILLLVDNGSGALVDTARYGLAHEPMPREMLALGADIVTFSTDKLLGGPQGGVIAGRRELVTQLKRHPLARAMRPDKTAIAALHATLAAYVRGEETTIPAIRMLSRSPGELKAQAERIAAACTDLGLSVTVEAGESTVGGGSLPGQTLPTWLVVVKGARSATELAAALRCGSIAVVARVARGRLLFDPRTLLEDDEADLITALREVVAQ
jgi:L-seryl-tRNA(Ser) seleniumtransferase